MHSFFLYLYYKSMQIYSQKSGWEKLHQHMEILIETELKLNKIVIYFLP